MKVRAHAVKAVVISKGYAHGDPYLGLEIHEMDGVPEHIRTRAMCTLMALGIFEPGELVTASILPKEGDEVMPIIEYGTLRYV